MQHYYRHMNNTAQTTMRSLSKRPAVYVSRHESKVTRKPMTAVNWVMVDPAPATDMGYESIPAGWAKGKDAATGYISWDTLAKLTGSEIYHLAAMVKTIWKKDPSAVSFSINRMGDGTYIRINKPELFKSEPLPTHWTAQRS